MGKVVSFNRRLIGRRVYYTGDIANQPSWGTLTEISPGRFGEQWKITFDDGREAWIAPTAFSPGSGKRFYWAEEWEAERERKLREALKSAAKILMQSDKAR